MNNLVLLNGFVYRVVPEMVRIRWQVKVLGSIHWQKHHTSKTELNCLPFRPRNGRQFIARVIMILQRVSVVFLGLAQNSAASLVGSAEELTCS